MAIELNGRFLMQPITGVQRFAREAMAAINARDPNLLRLIVPSNVSDEHLPNDRMNVSRGQLRGHLWEQLELPIQSRGHFLVNLCNTAPVCIRHQLVVLHDVAFLARPENFSRRFRYWYRAMVFGYLTRGAQLATVSRFSATQIAEQFNYPLSKIFVVSEGSEHISKIMPDDSLVVAHALRDRPFALAVSSVVASKNFGAVAEAAKTLEGNVRIVAVGRKPDSRVFTNTKLTSDKLIYLGYVTDAQLRALYEAATCFVFPSFYEGFGLPAVEAMRCGCPVIVSREGALHEVCEDAALYCDARDPSSVAQAILRIVNNPILRSELIEAGKMQAFKFSWNATAERLMHLLPA